MTEEQVGFDVVDEVQVGDLSGVQAEILPVAPNVKVRISKASIKTSKDKALKSLNLQLNIVDGIMIGDELKYVNKPIFTGFMDLCVWADPTVKTSQWYKSQQHLLGLKQLCLALEIDVKSVKINDEWLASLIGRELLINIVHEEETAMNADGERIKTGTFREKIGKFTKLV